MSSSQSTPARLAELRLMRKVRDRIDRDYSEPLDLTALARGINISTGHLSRQFKAAYGVSPYNYLMTRRIEQAMTLLRRGDLSVTQVCFAVGCSSLGSFTTRFTQLVSISPGEYRKLAEPLLEGLPSCVVKQVSRPLQERPRQLAENPRQSDHD